jgi:hypothetical protein
VSWKGIDVADRWKVTVTFDRDGTDSVVLTGWRISTQMWAPRHTRTTRCLVKAFDEAGKLTRSVQCAAVWTIERERIDG